MARKYTTAEMQDKRFGRLVVVREAEPQIQVLRSRRYWLCQCDCGATSLTEQSKLLSGHTRSCGCLKTERGRENGKRNRTHGRTHTAEYFAWGAMLRRCTDPHNIGYKDYGGRGITVCERWRSFAAFFADMGPRSSPAHSIDRFPDNNGNYEPGNCRWATKEEQDNNRRSSRFLTFQGQRLSCAQWARRLGFHYNLIYQRLRKGWTIERTLTEPPKEKRQSTR